MNLVIYLAIAAFVVFFDLFTKFLVKGSELLTSGGVIEIIPGVFRFRYVENPGAAMGSLAGNRWVFMVFSTVAIIGILIYMAKKHKTMNRLAGVAMSMIVGGGIGNMYERLFNQNARGQYVVTDFLDFYLFDFWKWVFNVADVAVCVGAGLVILYLVLDLIHEYRASKHPEQYDELVALYTLEADEDSIADLMALDGAETEPESPLIWTSENDGESISSDEEDALSNLPEEEPEDLSDLALLDGAYMEEDTFPIYDADDADGDEENDFFVEDEEEEDLL